MAPEIAQPIGPGIGTVQRRVTLRVVLCVVLLVGCSALAPIDQFLLLFPKVIFSKSDHQTDIQLMKDSEGLRPLQKDPLTGSIL